MFRVFPIVLASFIALFDPADGQGATMVPDCAAIAARISIEKGLPQGLLQAIARVESGRRRQSGQVEGWPWTTNNAGDGRYFADRTSALEHIKRLRAAGKTNVDIGCMQINWRWHADQFPSLEAMIDPEQNVRYAAHFLSKLFHRHGSWEKAIRFYHSGTPQYNMAYLSRVRAAWPEASLQVESNDPLARTPLAETRAPSEQVSSAPVGFWSLWSTSRAETGDDGTPAPLVSSSSGHVLLKPAQGSDWISRLAEMNGIDKPQGAESDDHAPAGHLAQDDT